MAITRPVADPFAVGTRHKYLRNEVTSPFWWETVIEVLSRDNAQTEVFVIEPGPNGPNAGGEPYLHQKMVVLRSELARNTIPLVDVPKFKDQQEADEWMESLQSRFSERLAEQKSSGS